MNKPVTLSDLASVSGLAVSTVSRALNNDPKISVDTVATVHKMAKQMGYRSPARKRLEHERQEAAQQTGEISSLCLLLPYPFKEYNYTQLDLMMIDTAEQCMHEVDGVLYITRLGMDGKLPRWLVERGVDAVVMKSYQMPPVENCPLLYNAPVVSVFGFALPNAPASWVTSDTHRGIQEVWEGVVVPKHCTEVVLAGLNWENQEMQEKAAFLKGFCERENLKYSEYRFEKDDSIASISGLAEVVRKAKGKPLVYVARTTQMDIERALQLPAIGIRTGIDAEIVVEVYDCNPALNPEYHWLDLRGRDLVRSAVHYALHPGSRTQSRIQLPPNLVPACTIKEQPATPMVENSYA